MFDEKNYEFVAGKHQNIDVIWVRFVYNETLKNELREKYAFAKWSATNRCWYLPDNNQVRESLGMHSKEYEGKQILAQIHPVNQPALKRMAEQLKLKGYSPNTLKTYCTEFAQLLYLLKDTHVDSLTPERLRAYFLYCIDELKQSENLIHSRLNAIKFYFEQVLHREKFFIDIPRPKKKSMVPKVFSQAEILKLFGCTGNIKHRLMLKFSYGMGLRVSEIVGIKIAHVDSARMQVLVASGKGKKDRYVALPESILEEMRMYYRQYRPQIYLFEGQYGGQYAIRSVQSVFKNAMRKAGICKQVGIHGLRHSYATHLLEAGTDMYLIQKLLGHKDVKTTEIYAKVSNRQLTKVKSPLDNL